jgi:hypothetical protein
MPDAAASAMTRRLASASDAVIVPTRVLRFTRDVSVPDGVTEPPIVIRMRSAMIPVGVTVPDSASAGSQRIVPVGVDDPVSARRGRMKVAPEGVDDPDSTIDAPRIVSIVPIGVVVATSRSRAT